MIGFIILTVFLLCVGIWIAALLTGISVVISIITWICNNWKMTLPLGVGIAILFLIFAPDPIGYGY